MTSANSAFPMMQKAVSLHQKGQVTEAEQAYREVLAVDPQHVDALRLLGGLYIQNKKVEQAIECFETALSIQPNQPEILTNLGVALYNQGKVNDAVLRYQQAIEVAPDYVDAINNLANIFYTSGKLDDAIMWLECSLALKPNDPRTYVVLGHALHRQKKESEAIPHFRRALELVPDNSEIMAALGNALRDAGKSVEACAVYQRLAVLRPDDVNVHLNLGTILHDVGQFTKALEQYELVLKLQPNSTDAMINRASVLIELNRPEEARASYEQSLSLNPNLSDAKWGKSLAMLMAGDYAGGWALYEARFERKFQSRIFQDARWDGRSLDGKRLLIWGEQGLGDVLQFIRYAVLCKEKGGTIIVQCSEPLVRLLKACPFIDAVVTTAKREDFDYQIPVMSLPHLFGTTLDTVPQNIPYLYVGDDVRRTWAPRFADVKGLKIGLVWAGNPRKSQIDAHITDRQRSLSLAAMKPLLNVEGCRFYSLQKGEASGDIRANKLNACLIDFMPDVNDMMDTAAIIQNLDLVISVDTSVVHLAGGLGKSVWVLSRFGGCWRWLQNQESNPWYPTVRVFGQTTPGDWQSCIDKVVVALQEKLFK